MTFASREMLPRNLQIFHWNYSLNLLSKLNSYLACHSGRCSAAAITGLSGLAEASEGLSLWFVWLQENFFISCCSCWQIRSFSWGLYLMTLVCPLGKDKYTCAKLSRDSTFTPVTQTTVITSGWIPASHSWISLGPNPGSTTAQLCELRQMTSLP